MVRSSENVRDLQIKGEKQDELKEHSSHLFIKLSTFKVDVTNCAINNIKNFTILLASRSQRFLVNMTFW